MRAPARGNSGIRGRALTVRSPPEQARVVHVRAPALPVTLSVLASILGGVSVLWLIIRVLIDPPGGRGIGGWVGLLGAAAITYGGFASVRLEGIAPEDGPAEIPTVELTGITAH